MSNQIQPEASVTLYRGDCRDVLATLPPDSVSAVVCDPPYDLTAGKNGGGGFMDLAWDATGVAFDPETWKLVLRVLKPGGFLLAFGGTRTWHRQAVAVEDAGFELKNTVAWIHAQGFPKSRNVSKDIDKSLGAERRVVGTKTTNTGMQGGNYGSKSGQGTVDVTVPATREAEEWVGWGTALKPAFEPVLVARKPTKQTVARNVLEHGTGGLNIDACRIGEDGRWPANVVFDEETGRLLDEQSGVRPAGRFPGALPRDGLFGGSGLRHGGTGPDGQALTLDSGGASHFFYCPKPSKKEKGATNIHVTVKPLNLMKWLVRLVTPPGGLVLDPFAGSGTTLLALAEEGFPGIGIESNPAYFQIGVERMDGTAWAERPYVDEDDPGHAPNGLLDDTRLDLCDEELEKWEKTWRRA